MIDRRRAAALALAGLVAALLAGCGSNSTVTTTVTQTTTVTPTMTTSSTQTTATTTTVTSSTLTTATATTSSSATATSTTQTTRTESAPAFVTPPHASAELRAAIAVLAKAGYVPVATSTYDPADTLRVLIGRRASGATGELAFFFDQTTYLGTDSTTPSASLSVVGSSDTEVVIAYAIFSPATSTPSSRHHVAASGHRNVAFELDMGQLGHMQALPSVAARR